MKRKKTTRRGLLFTVCAAALVLAVVSTAAVSGTLGKYAAAGKGEAQARIAKFDVEVTENQYYGENVVYYWHKALYTDQGWGMYLTVKNNSEVTLRVQLRFYNVLQDNAKVAAGFQWTNTGHRREWPAAGVSYHNAWNAISDTYPRFRVRSFSAADAPYPPAHALYYSTAAGQEGVVLPPQESVLLGWNVSGELYQAGTATNVAVIDDTAGDGTLDRAFRINYDIIATQVD